MSPVLGKITKIFQKVQRQKYDSLIDTFQSRKLHPLVTLIIDHYHDVFDIYYILLS